MEVSVEFLTKRLRYEVPPQDLALPLSGMPAIPKRGFRMRNVERVEAPRA